MSDELLKDPVCAALYLEECLAGGDLELFKIALKKWLMLVWATYLLLQKNGFGTRKSIQNTFKNR